MKIFPSWLSLSILALSFTQILAASWTFADASVSVQSKGTGVGGSRKENLSPGKPLSKAIELGPGDSLKVILTAQEGKTARRPHQVFLLLKDATSNLDVSFPLSVKESGKAKVDLAYKDLPSQFLRGQSKISASIVIASFGGSTGYNSNAFSLSVVTDKSVSPKEGEKAMRYGKQPEIHHIFRSEPKSPNVLISTIFTFGAIAGLPLLLVSWLALGGNLHHLSDALSAAPIAHALFLGSIIGLEGILFMYYSSWNLFQTLPALVVVGTVTFVSGSRALTEVQDRRLAGKR